MRRPGKFSVGVADAYQTESLLLQYRPFEVLHQRGGLSNEIRSWLRKCTPTAVWTAMPVGSQASHHNVADVPAFASSQLRTAWLELCYA